jgi:hypothetical protein
LRLPPLLIAVVVVVAGCGGGHRTTETRAVAPFDRLEIADSVDVQVVPGDGREVRVYGGEDVLDRVETESSAGVLRIDVRDRGIVIGPDPLGDVRVQVATSALDAVEIAGSADVELGGLDLPQLELEIKGAGEVAASGTADRLAATIHGAGDAELSDLAVPDRDGRRAGRRRGAPQRERAARREGAGRCRRRLPRPPQGHGGHRRRRRGRRETP